MERTKNTPKQEQTQTRSQTFGEYAQAQIPRPDSEQIKAFVKLLLREGGCIELRVLGNKGATKFDDRQTLCGFYDDPIALARDAEAYHGRRAVYFGLNSRHFALLHAQPANMLKPGEGGGNGDVTGKDWFPLDVDSVRESTKVAATQAELSAALAVRDAVMADMKCRGIQPIPGMSGNGGHALVRTPSYPLNKNSDGKDGEFALLLRHFHRKYGNPTANVDAVNFDPARIWKVYGTAATKGGNTVERPWRTATFEIPAIAPTPVDILAIYASEIQEQREFEAKERSKSKAGNAHSGGSADWRSVFSGDLATLDFIALFTSREMYHGPAGTNYMHKVKCPWCEEHTDGRDESVIFESHDGCWPGFKCQHSHCSNRGLREVLEWFGTEAVDSFCSARSRKKPEKRSSDFQFTPLGVLLDEPDEKIPWIVEGLLPAGGTAIVAAKAKVGKTTFARQLALAVARGEPFLGRNTIKGPVIYIAVEEKRDEIKKHFRDMGANGTEEVHVHVATAPEDAIEKLIPIANEIKPKLIINDTLFRIVRVEDNNAYSAVIAALEPVQELARVTGAHVLSIHHKGKSQREGTDGVLGSMAIQGAFDTNIMMDRKDNERTIFTEQRYGKDMPPSKLVFNEVTRRLSLGESVKESERFRIGKQIWDFLHASGQAQPESAIQEAVSGQKGKLVDALRNLVRSGYVVRSGAGKSGKPFLYGASPNSPPMAEAGTQF